MGNEKEIWESVGLKMAPTTVVLSEGIDQNSYTKHFLLSYQKEMQELAILPIHIDCHATSALGFWNNLASTIREETRTLFEKEEKKKEIINRKYELIKTFKETESIKNNIIWILGKIKEHTNNKILLAFSNFDVAISLLDEFDSMKWREFTNTVIVLTFSYKTLIELGKAKYNNSYYCNQFEDAIFINK